MAVPNRAAIPARRRGIRFGATTGMSRRDRAGRIEETTTGPGRHLVTGMAAGPIGVARPETSLPMTADAGVAISPGTRTRAESARRNSEVGSGPADRRRARPGPANLDPGRRPARPVRAPGGLEPTMPAPRMDPPAEAQAKAGETQRSRGSPVQGPPGATRPDHGRGRRDPRGLRTRTPPSLPAVGMNGLGRSAATELPGVPGPTTAVPAAHPNVRSVPGATTGVPAVHPNVRSGPGATTGVPAVHPNVRSVIRSIELTEPNVLSAPSGMNARIGLSALSGVNARIGLSGSRGRSGSTVPIAWLPIAGRRASELRLGTLPVTEIGLPTEPRIPDRRGIPAHGGRALPSLGKGILGKIARPPVGRHPRVMSPGTAVGHPRVSAPGIADRHRRVSRPATAAGLTEAVPPTGAALLVLLGVRPTGGPVTMLRATTRVRHGESVKSRPAPESDRPRSASAGPICPNGPRPPISIRKSGEICAA